ncbi:MAG: hypothetical protein ACXWZK_08275 [Solirubrobacterales bacterium]
MRTSPSRAKLVGPGGDNFSPFPLGEAGGQSLGGLKFDDQSSLQLCNPLSTPTTGFYTGFTHGFLNPVFRGGNPRGTWRLVWWDTSSVTTHEIGTATLTVRTGKKFAKR